MIGVCIVTFNQEEYIAQTIESVLMQEPSGQVVKAYIGDDCSTDGTGIICDQYASNYPDRIVVFHNETNLGLVGNTLELLKRMKQDGCSYIAMLDGDDYWSDPVKLKKQIDCFDRYPDCGLVHTGTDTLFPSGLQRDTRSKPHYMNVFHILEHYRICNCSVMFKADLLDLIDFDEFEKLRLKSLDYVMYACFSSVVPFAFLPDHMAVWRREHESVSNSTDMNRQIAYLQNDITIWQYLANRFPNRWKFDEKSKKNYYHTKVFHIAFKYGDRKRAVEESRQISQLNKKLRIKVFVAHSPFLFFIWRKMKSMNTFM